MHLREVTKGCKQGSHFLVANITEGGLPVQDIGSNHSVRVLDCVGLHCPMPVLKTREEMDTLAIGDRLEVLADDPAAEPDIKAWAKRTGQIILEIEKTRDGLRFLIEKTK